MNPPNIVLVGFMGTGKSAVGRRLARCLRRDFIDMDAVIEERAGKSISRIFAEDGEPYFRRLERALVQELAREPNRVIAGGGGVVLNPDNLADFSRSGLVVCLTAAPEEILRRVKTATHRPLLQTDDPAGRIRELLQQRQPFYDAIPCRVDTTGLTLDEVVSGILAMFDEYAARHSS